MSEEFVSDSIQRVNPTELYRHIQYAIDTKRAPFIWGDPGIGKSAIIQFVARKFGYHFEDVRLSQIDSVDLRGLPTKSYDRFDDEEVSVENPERGPIVEWAMPDFLSRARKAKLKDKKPTLFFFDEFNSAMKNTLAAAYQLVLDRRIGCFDLGEDDVVIAAGNFETNGGVTTMMPTPLANRFVHYNLKVSPNDWLDFAHATQIHPYVIAFIERNKQALHTFNDDLVGEDEKAFGTPRSWHFGSDLLYRILKNEVKGSMFDDDDDAELLYFEDNSPTKKLTNDELIKDIRVAIAGCVGKSLAQEFISFVKIGLNMPLPTDILDGKVTETDFFKQDDDISREYIMANSCIHELKIRYDRFKELKKSLAEHPDDAEIKAKFDEASDIAYRSIENYVTFAKKHFSSETFIFAIVQNMIRKHKIQPMPGKISKDAFELIKNAYNRASMRGNKEAA
jgi:hypothetical protein